MQLGDLGLVRGEPLVLLGQFAGMGLVLLLELRREPGDLLARQRRGLGGERGVELRLQRHHIRRGEWWYDVHTTTWNSSRSTASDTSGRICRFSWTAVLAIRRIAVSFCVMPCGTLALNAASLIFAARSSR